MPAYVGTGTNSVKNNTLMKKMLLITLLACCQAAFAQTDTVYSQIPFEGIDQTWHNGGDRRDSAVLAGKYWTAGAMVDVNYTNSLANPIDHTVVGSTAIARNGDLQIALAAFGGEFNYKNARGKLWLQVGTNTTVIPRDDYSAYRGQYDLANAYKNIAEAYGGYHFNKWHGINVDAGLFVSYIGLNSYYQVENWEYQASFTSDNTPWFFNGIRIQIFPTKNLKIEPWIVNGWQSYSMYNSLPGFGGNITWMPNSNLKILTNDYYGSDAAGLPGRHRFHSDNSLLYRYYNNPGAKGITKMAFSSTFDIGWEQGGGVVAFNGNSITPSQNFISGMVYNRIWFGHDRFAWTAGGGFITNPGRYLVLYPTGDANPLPNPNNPTQTLGTHPFSANPGDQFKGWDCSTNIDWMPNQSVTFRAELVYRETNVPYFAGHGGVTSPSGYTTTALPAGWAPDLVKSEARVIFAMLFRI